MIVGISRGDIGQGFVSGMVSSGVSSIAGGLNTAIKLKGTASDISTMLFGSVGGGVSAELAGGNFWQGAATGLTVSALNHVAHKMNEKSILLKSLKGSGYSDPKNTKAAFSTNTLDELVEKVPLIGDMYELSGKPEYYAKNNPTGSSNLDGHAFAKYDGDMTKLINKPYIYVYKNAFRSIYNTASTLMHEFYHVYTHNSGIYLNYFNRFRNHPYRDGLMSNLMEYSATNFEVILGNTSAIYAKDNYLRMFKAYAR